MKKLLSRPLFWSNVVSIVITGLVMGSVAFGWNSPSSAPTTANGAISTDALYNVTFGGNVNWTGYALTGGSVPWARLSGVPASPCASGFVNNIATGGCAPASVAWSTGISGVPAPCTAGNFFDNLSTGHCGSPAAGGGVTGSGTAGNLTAWTSATAIGNASGAITFPGDIIANNNTYGAQAAASGAAVGGNTSFSAWGNSTTWTLACPAGYYLISVGQVANLGNGTITPNGNCAKL